MCQCSDLTDVDVHDRHRRIRLDLTCTLFGLRFFFFFVVVLFNQLNVFHVLVRLINYLAPVPPLADVDFITDESLPDDYNEGVPTRETLVR